MKYSNIISDMTWSYSRIKCFESCPYGFFLKYIKCLKGCNNFFAGYGSLMHSILEQHLLGLLEKQDMLTKYLSRFKSAVGRPPTPAIFKTYFNQGLHYLSGFEFPHKRILGVERRVNFSIEDMPFVGVIDYEADNGKLVLGDHKSRALRKRTKRKKPTRTDRELDDFLRQLYLYSIPFKEAHGRYPDILEFNCFRIGEVISEEFSEEKLEETKQWTKNMIDKIINNEDWAPNMEYWKCRYLCDQNQNCEYYQMNRR